MKGRCFFMDSTLSGFSFNLQPLDHMIVEAIRKSIESIMPDIMDDFSLTERNGYKHFRWNPIISSLREFCHHLGWVEIGTCKRGAWVLPILFHPASRHIITLMTEETFKRAQRKKDKGTYYLCAAASFNKSVHPKHEQLSLNLPPIDEVDRKWIAHTQEQLATCVNASVGEISGHILVIFQEIADKITSVRAVRLTEKLELSTEEENWSKLIHEAYSTEVEVIPPPNDDNGEDEPLVELK